MNVKAYHFNQLIAHWSAYSESSGRKHLFETVAHEIIFFEWWINAKLYKVSSSSSSSFGCSIKGCHSGYICTEDLALFYAGCPSWRNLLIVGNLARPFNVLGCTLEGNQLRHCAAKLIVQLAIMANTKWVFTPVVLRSRDQPSMSQTHYSLNHWGSQVVVQSVNRPYPRCRSPCAETDDIVITYRGHFGTKGANPPSQGPQTAIP